MQQRWWKYLAWDASNLELKQDILIVPCPCVQETRCKIQTSGCSLCWFAFPPFVPAGSHLPGFKGSLLSFPLLAIVDPDGRIYICGWQGGILSGGFEKNPKPIFTEGRNQLEIQNLQEDWDHFGRLERKPQEALVAKRGIPSCIFNISLLAQVAHMCKGVEWLQCY